MTTRRRAYGPAEFPIPDGAGPNGRPLCRVCGQEVAPRRRTFCSKACADHYAVATNPRMARRLVARRDKGVCAACGLDTQALNRAMKQMPWPERRAMRERMGFPLRGPLWHADHIVAVADGGGGCGLENFQSLCVPCHLKKTAEETARRRKASEERKAAKRARKSAKGQKRP